MRRDTERRRRWWRWILLLAVLATGLYLGRAVWLRGLGEFLVRAEAPRPADAAVVLAGDWSGGRILRAVELAREGYVKQVLVDGPQGTYGTDEADLAIRFAVSEGAPRDIFVPLPMRVNSTLSEARIVDAELRKRKLRKVLVVTSTFHTRRARDVYERVGSADIEYRLVSAEDEYFTPAAWWRTRDGQKIVFLEYLKLLYWWLVERP